MNKLLSFYIIAFSFLSFSCEKGEVFTGKPDPSIIQFENVPAIITTSEEWVSSGQTFPITIDISPKVFDVDVSLQVTIAVQNTDRIARTIIDLKAGQSVVTSDVTSPNGPDNSTTFDNKISIFMSNISTASTVIPSGFLGKQYTISSNIKEVNLFNTAATTESEVIERTGYMCINYLFENDQIGGSTQTNFNNFDLIVRRNGVVITIPQTTPNLTNPVLYYGITVSSVGKRRFVAINKSLAPDGVYILEIKTKKLFQPLSNIINSGFVVVNPEGKSRTYVTPLSNVVVDGIIQKLQVTKTTVGVETQFEVVVL